MPDHPAVWIRASGAELWHRQLDPDLAKGWRAQHPDRRAACGEVIAAPVERAAASSSRPCARCAEISDYEARFPPT